MSPAIPAGRIQLDAVAPRQTLALVRFMRAIELDERLRTLVSTRASQMNGCAFCLDMHWKDALAAGESKERLYSLDVWRESPLYEERERAALELTEAMTFVADGHVPGEVWNRARAAFGEDELAQLVFAIAAINAANRLNITARLEPGHYKPGMLQAA